MGTVIRFLRIRERQRKLDTIPQTGFIVYRICSIDISFIPRCSQFP